MGPVKAMVMGGENSIFSSPKLAHIRKPVMEPPLNFDAFIQQSITLGVPWRCGLVYPSLGSYP